MKLRNNDVYQSDGQYYVVKKHYFCFPYSSYFREPITCRLIDEDYNLIENINVSALKTQWSFVANLDDVDKSFKEFLEEKRG